MKRSIETCSIWVCDTLSCLAYGEMTKEGQARTGAAAVEVGAGLGRPAEAGSVEPVVERVVRAAEDRRERVVVPAVGVVVGDHDRGRPPGRELLEPVDRLGEERLLV